MSALHVDHGLRGEESAADAEEAIRAIKRLRPNIVLLDVQLPDTNGFEVAAKLCSDGTHIDVVLTSSRDASEFGELVGACGSRGFIPKGELSGGRLAALLK